MKASLKLREDQKQPTLNQPQNQTENNPKSQYQNPLLRAKIPISVLGFPFLSILTAGDSSDLSFGIRTNSINGPSLKFSYSPNISSTTQTPFSISLKSGVGFFGSPQNSPLIMSAQFNLFGNPNPSFFLQIKPQFGDFSLKKTAVSAPLTNPNPKTPSFTKENGEKNHFTDDIGVMLERPLVWKELTEFRNGGDGVFSGVEVRAKTLLPITKKAVVKCRWGVNFPPDFGQKQRMPFLTVDKIAVERVEEKVEVNSQKKKNKDGSEGDLEVLKGLCLWMQNEVEGLKRENRILKESVDELNLGGSTLKSRRGSGSASKNVVSSSSPSTPGFEQWRNKKNGGEEKNSSGSESSKDEVGEELKRAIMAAKGEN
ncbi:uncharacterized protein LOC113291720 [Papaver somniferum]|uniref:uncharacterized protein LOC113291720 n=1 Tax=Papaver somniferum TaxID=3469 RepID=UPI000E6F7A7D|nr:uncharacterized protein LOC113291720 [Papaver somniferum]